MSELAGIHDALRRIEGGQGETLAELRNFRREMDEAKTHHIKHEEENRQDFVAAYAQMAKNMEIVNERFTDQTDDRKRHMGEQDVKLDGLLRDRNVAKGEGWVIIWIVGILGALVTHIGDAVLAALHIKIG